MALITTHCPPFAYETVPGASMILARRAKDTLIRLNNLSPIEKVAIGKDTRPVHQRYFAGLTPVGFEYYAGHYRGENFTCLKVLSVHIPTDPMVGHPPDRVLDDMAVFASDFENVITDGDIVWSANSKVIAPAEKLYRVIQLGVALFVYLLQIHPFANGNGHMARFFLISFLSRYGVTLSRWPLHPRPQDPPYSQFIGRYRRGDRVSLEHFVLSCI
jgi:Fic/DOC family